MRRYIPCLSFCFPLCSQQCVLHTSWPKPWLSFPSYSIKISPSIWKLLLSCKFQTTLGHYPEQWTSENPKNEAINWQRNQAIPVESKFKKFTAGQKISTIKSYERMKIRFLVQKIPEPLFLSVTKYHSAVALYLCWSAGTCYSPLFSSSTMQTLGLTHLFWVWFTGTSQYLKEYSCKDICKQLSRLSVFMGMLNMNACFTVTEQQYKQVVEPQISKKIKQLTISSSYTQQKKINCSKISTQNKSIDYMCSHFNN